MEHNGLTKSSLNEILYPFKLDGLEISMALLAKALRAYTEDGKTTKQFEEEFGCKLILDDVHYGIRAVKFHNDSNKTMFMLKYKS